MTTPPLHAFIAAMPKVELHVHLEGAMPPQTLLRLAATHGIDLPPRTVDEVKAWYTFRDFPHFVDIYVAMSDCIRTLDDLETLTYDFLTAQADQNVRHTEFTYTPFTHTKLKGWTFEAQHDAVQRGRRRAEADFGITARAIYDIAREVPPDDGLITARAVVDLFDEDDHGLAGLGLGGYEVGHPASKHAPSFALARAAGIPLILHAGETEGAPSIRDALDQGSIRIGHGVRCLEDRAVTAELRDRGIPLEVCPSSNVCLGVVPSLADHPLPHLLAAGLVVTINSDDPPLFDTTLTDELTRCADAFGFTADNLIAFTQSAARAARLNADEQARLLAVLDAGFATLRTQHAV